MAKLTVTDLRVTLGENEILKGLSLETKEGDVVALLGQSGCGKTTLLRSIAGLETPVSGRIQVGATTIFDAATNTSLPPEKRGLGLVFQSYALWPHKTVRDNVLYGLKLKGSPNGSIKDKAQEVMDGIGIGHLGDRLPNQLSGGQQQRVALARALAYDPPIILLDEPLSNLDAKLREEARIWIRSLIKKTGRTAVFVTHDQEEAMAVADQVVLLDEGKLIQSGTPQELYGSPQSLFAATFMGSNNTLNGRVLDARDGQVQVDVGGSAVWALNKGNRKVGDAVTVVSRLEVAAACTEAAPNAIACVREAVAFLGSRWEYMFRAGEQHLRVTTRTELAGGENYVVLPATSSWAF